jgi:hypothetical protein
LKRFINGMISDCDLDSGKFTQPFRYDGRYPTGWFPRTAVARRQHQIVTIIACYAHSAAIPQINYFFWLPNYRFFTYNAIHIYPRKRNCYASSEQNDFI